MRRPFQSGNGRTRHAIRHTLAVGLLLTALGAAVAGPPGYGYGTHALPRYSKGIHGLEHAGIRSDGALVARGQVSGRGTVRAEHVVIEGMLTPGDSPGCIDFGGDVTFSFTAVLMIEIGGATPCTEHDRIGVYNQLTINNARLEVSLINDFVPAYEDSFDIIDWGSITGSFDTLDASLPAPLVWDTTRLYVTGELVVDVAHYANGDLAPWDNPDGLINAADVLVAVQLVLGLRTPGALQYAHGDMNIDSVFDLADLLLIQQAALQ
jgi:hypothetical protein